MKKFMTVLAILALVAFAAPAIAAANPFMDVPAGHWAYDAVAQLASRGIASGYPDGAYKGAQPATRYEMASMVARALAQIDMNKASRQDVELLKRLVLEFKNELDALGVKVSDLDKRVAVLEDGIGGWKIRGIFRFDAKFADSDRNDYGYNRGRENEFTKERFRLFLTKTIDENTYFYAQYRTGDNGAGPSANGGRGDQQHMRWSHLYVDTKLPYDIGLRVGRFAVDFEGAYGLYTDNDALFGDFRVDGFQANKSFGILNATAAVGRNFGPGSTGTTNDHMAYILDLNFQPNEKFMIGATGYWGIEDSAPAGAGDIDVNTYAFYAGYKFTPAIALKGVYYFQDLGDDVPGAAAEDSPTAWKAILDVKQEALKFTSLWVEYSQVDNSFFGQVYDRYSFGGNTNSTAYMMKNTPLNAETSKILFVVAKQKWTDKWSTFLRYGQVDFDTTGLDDAKTYGIGVGYQYTPAINFELAYDVVDYGTNTYSSVVVGNTGTTYGDGRVFQEKESVVRFRTTVSF